MKKTIKAAIAISMSALWLSLAIGEEVSSDVAEDAARGWINLREALGEEITAEPESVLTYDAKDGKGKYYVVNLQGGGFVVTSGDTEIEPILAYSKDSTWNTNATQNPLMVMLNFDVAAVMEAASTSSASSTSSGGRRLAAAAPSAKATKWARLRSAASAKGGARLQAGSLSSLGDVRVNTLMETKWGQEDHGENQYTPRGYVCGCVATAGAQIMRYWRYPTASITKIKDYYGTVDGTASWTLNDGYQTTVGGSYTAWNDDVKTFGGTYDWNNMPATVSWLTSTAQKKAIGKLTLDVGRSVHMDYAKNGSGSHYSLIATRLVDQFQYKNAALIIKKDGCSLDEIKRAILPSLDLKSPCGVSVPGHAIVADGYGYNSGTLYVHFNLGWTGTDNAWYNPPDLTDADSDFTSIDTIIYNIYPPSVCSDSGRTIVSGRLLNSSGSILANTTVTARNRSSGATYTATTDAKGIYALLVPAASYTISATKDNCSASTNLTVAACVSTRLSNETGSSYYPSSPTPVVGNVHGVELTLNQMPAPTFSRANTVTYTTIFDGYVNLTISSSVSGATIRYTLDGSDPTSSSTAYSGALQISSTCTVKARAFKSGYLESEVAEITFNKLSPTGDLILNGGFEQNTVTQNSGVWSYSNGDGFSCKYWTFASNAGLAAPNSTWVANHSDFGGKAAFIQTNGAGSESFVAQEFVIPNAATYDFKFTYAARPGYVGVTTHVLLIRGSVTNEIASVSPSATSPSEYSGQVSVNAAATHILRFVQTGVSGDKANIIDNVTFQMAKLPEPTFSPAAATFITDSVDVTLACATAGATIRYTLDGSEPTSSSAAYSAPITIDVSTTIKAKAFKSGYVESDTVSATYIFADQAAPPTSTSTAGYRTTLVDLASTIPGAVIRYTTDGSDPTEQSEVYTAGTSINVTNATGATTIKARVYAEGYRPSDVFSYDYYVKQFFGPTNGVNAAVWEDTPQNRADHWILENESYKEATGLWSNAVEYVDGKVKIDERNDFIPDSPSAGRNVTIETTASFSSIAEEHLDYDGVKAAVRICTNACFQVYTTNASGRVWLDAAGVTAEVNRDYTVRVELDLTNKTYTAAVKDGADYVPLTAGGSASFPFAHADTAPFVQSIGYAGEGTVASIHGSYLDPLGFVAGDVEGLGKSITLTEAEADWLNCMGDYARVKGKLDGLARTQFDEAYLLNSDFTADDYLTRGWGTFSISDMSVDDEKVTVVVRLVRNFALKDGAKEAPINGRLSIYGGDEIGAITNLQKAVKFSNTDFGDGRESTNTFNKAGVKLFYRAKIEKPGR